MILRSPVAALLWENWRLTRIEAAQRVGYSLVVGAGALMLFGVTQAFWILVMLHAFFYMSIAKLNGGKFMDGYKPGFPLYLLYTRPVSTFTFVGVAMAYDALSGAGLYLATAGLLSYTFDQPLPLFSMALLILVYHLAYMCIQWSTRSRITQWVGSIVITLPVFWLLKDHAASPAQIQLSPVDALLLVLAGVVFVILTVAGVSRQRRGELSASKAKGTGSPIYPDWLLGLFRIPCPTDSATGAQVWFELRSSGLPALAVGLGFAVLILLLFVLAIWIDTIRPLAFTSVMMAGPALLLLLGGNAFGIRKRQGRAYASAFEVTQPFATAHLVGLKLLVRTASVMVALLVVAAGVWVASSFLGAWGTWVIENGKDAIPEFLKIRGQIGNALSTLFTHSLVLIVAVLALTSVLVATVVAALATFSAARARYPRQLLVGGSTFLLYCLGLIALALAEQGGHVPSALVWRTFAITGWVFVVSLVLASIYLFWRGFVERALTQGYAVAVVLITLACGAAYGSALYVAGFPFAELNIARFVGIFWPILLPLVVGLLAPWTLGRLRHQ